MSSENERDASTSTRKGIFLILVFVLMLMLASVLASLAKTRLKLGRRQRQRHLKMLLHFHLCYFAIILTRSTSTQTTNYPGTKLVGMTLGLRKRMKNSPSCAHVLHKTLNLVISRCCFAEDGEKCTKIKPHVQSDWFCSLNMFLRRCRYRRRRQLLKFSINAAGKPKQQDDKVT